jgi:hypothetical protein
MKINFLKYFLSLILLILLIKVYFSLFNNELASNNNSNSNNQIVFHEKKDVARLIEKHLNRKNVNKLEIVKSKQEIKYLFLKKYPKMLDCNPKSIPKWPPIDKYIPLYRYVLPAENESFNHRYLRGILIYLQLDPNNKYNESSFIQFKWFYKSWIEMIKYEPTKWRTDLIIFVEKKDDYFSDNKFFLNELNCSFLNKRRSNMDKPMCTLIEYTPIAKRNFGNNYQNEANKFENLLDKINIFDKTDDLSPFYSLLKHNLKTYSPHTDSILMAFDGYEYFKSSGFDFLIRTDMDIFVNSLFSKWLPKHCNDFIVSGSSYSENFNRKRLKIIAQNLHLEYANVDNLGSTWISTPDQFRIVSYLTLTSMMYISEEEFSQPEKQGKLNLWPYWHYGVLLLYGQNIAINHLITTNNINVIKLFKDGKYVDLTIPIENLDQVKLFSSKMILEAKQESATNLYELLKVEGNLKN